jgi:hypothetical protein
MIVFGYFAGISRKGMLAFRETPDGERQAIGGFDPGAYPGDGAVPTTVVTTDGAEVVYTGWIHPDDYWEQRPCLQIVPSGTVEEAEQLLLG